MSFAIIVARHRMLVVLNEVVPLDLQKGVDMEELMINTMIKVQTITTIYLIQGSSQ